MILSALLSPRLREKKEKPSELEIETKKKEGVPPSRKKKVYSKTPRGARTSSSTVKKIQLDECEKKKEFPRVSKCTVTQEDVEKGEGVEKVLNSEIFQSATHLEFVEISFATMSWTRLPYKTSAARVSFLNCDMLTERTSKSIFLSDTVKKLRIDGCQNVSDWIWEFCSSYKLKELCVENCNKVSLDPASFVAIGDCTTLRRLSLAGCTGVKSDHISLLYCLPALKILDLRRVDVFYSDLDWLKHLRHLEYVGMPEKFKEKGKEKYLFSKKWKFLI